MGRKSTKEDKTIYQIHREKLGLSRDQASELLVHVSSDRLNSIETKGSLIRPDEVLVMSEKYQAPSLCNHYCSNECPIGQKYVPKVDVNELSSVVLQMLASLNSVEEKKNRLIEITADGQIQDSELDDFINIQEELEKISATVNALQLWTEEMKANGSINKELYEKKANKKLQ